MIPWEVLSSGSRCHSANKCAYKSRVKPAFDNKTNTSCNPQAEFRKERGHIASPMTLCSEVNLHIRKALCLGGISRIIEPAQEGVGVDVVTPRKNRSRYTRRVSLQNGTSFEFSTKLTLNSKLALKTNAAILFATNKCTLLQVRVNVGRWCPQTVYKNCSN